MKLLRQYLIHHGKWLPEDESTLCIVDTHKGKVTNVGKRHGNPVVLEIDAKSMWTDGCGFYLSRNAVWLNKFVDVKYIEINNI